METKVKSILEVVRDYTIECHKSINQVYGKYLPYEFHQRAAVGVFHRFKFLIPEERWLTVEMGIWGHDVLEDVSSISYNDFKEVCGKEVADLVFAVTNNTGKTRAERADDNYYEKIRTTPYAVFVKLCDRIANIEYGKMAEWQGKSMLDKYRKENEEFEKKLWDKNYAVMFFHIRELLDGKKALIEKYPLEFPVFESELESMRALIKEANTHYVFEWIEEKESHESAWGQRWIYRVSCPTTSFANAYWHLGLEFEKHIRSKRK